MKTALAPWRFAQDLGIWVEADTPVRPVETRLLTVLTFNVWFSRLWLPERLDAILRIARAHDADLLALQEVTPEFLQRAIETDWIRDGYWTSDALGESVYPYGVWILSRLPIRRFTLLDLPSRMYRRLLVGQLAVGQDDVLVATVHLESLRESSWVRAQQLEIIQRHLRRHQTSLLMGDFNFCSSWAEETDNLDPDFKDVWPLLHPDDPGHTMSTAINAMEQDVKQEHKHVRFDRIVCRSPGAHWRPQSIEVVGREPVSDALPHVFPSDHFGLVARFERSPESRPRESL